MKAGAKVCKTQRFVTKECRSLLHSEYGHALLPPLSVGMGCGARFDYLPWTVAFVLIYATFIAFEVEFFLEEGSAGRISPREQLQKSAMAVWRKSVSGTIWGQNSAGSPQ